MPHERCRILRRRLARREQLTRVRTRVKNEIHATLQRRLQERPPCSDLIGVKGRQWLAGLELPLEERETVDAGIRQIEFLDAEIAAVDFRSSLARVSDAWIGRSAALSLPASSSERSLLQCSPTGTVDAGLGRVMQAPRPGVRGGNATARAFPTPAAQGFRKAQR